jgi:hypothetical protein
MEGDLTSQLFYKDAQEKMDATDPNGSGQMGLFERYKLMKGSISVDMEGPLYHDLFHNMHRYVINQVDVQVKLYRNNAKFCLMTAEKNQEYAIVLEDVVLKIMKVCVNPGIILAHNAALSTTTCKYPFKRTEVRMQALPAGQISFVWDQIFQGLRPTKVLVAFVSAKAVSGSYEENPFNFANYDISHINLLCDGMSYGDSGALKLKYSKSGGQNMVQAYTNLLRASGRWRTTGIEAGSINITRQEVDSGYAIYAYILEPVLSKSDSDGTYIHLHRQGNLRLETNFATPLPHSVNCIVYAEFQGFFQIDKSRNIIV